MLAVILLFLKKKTNKKNLNGSCVTQLSSLNFLVKTHLVSVLVREWARRDPAQSVLREWQFLLILVPGWFDSSHKQQKNLFHVTKWVFQEAAPALTRWCDPSEFWDVSAFLPPEAPGSRGWVLAGCEKPLGSNFYPVGYKWILEEMTVCFSGVAIKKNCILMVWGHLCAFGPFLSAAGFLVKR